MPATRSLTALERDLLAGALAPEFDGAQALREQMQDLLVAPGCRCGCGTIDLLPQGDPARSEAGSPLRSVGAVFDEHGAEVGGLLVFVEDGLLSGLEVYSYDDPLPLPPTERVRWSLR